MIFGSNSAGVLLGNGDGTFKPVSSFPTSASGNSAVFLGDFNGDSKLDLAVVTGSCDATPTCTRSVNVLIGNGDGTFGPPVGNQSTIGLNSQAVALGDVNGDGNLDLAVVDDCVPITDTCGDEFVDVFEEWRWHVQDRNELSFEYDRRHVHRVRGFERRRQAGSGNGRP